MSKFLKVNRTRFVQSFKQNSEDFVPWDLDDKVAAYDFVNRLGFKTPKYSTHKTAKEALNGVEERFVIKGSGGHSSKGVYVLEAQPDGRFLDLMKLRLWSISELIEDASKRPSDYWVREECVASTVFGRPIPFDYKIDCFGGQIVAITQIDRNFWPPRVAIFDGAFIPLEHGKDYSFDPDRWMPASPVLPIHASAMIDMARKLSSATGTRYVRVDCFDTLDGAVFGEFTFASGPPDVGMVKFSPHVLEQFDAALDGVRVERIAGFDLDYPRYWSECEQDVTPTSCQPPEVIGRLQAAASFGDRRYRQQWKVAPDGKLGQHYAFCVTLATLMAGDGSQLFGLQESVRVRSGFLNGSAREDELVEKAKAYHGARLHLGPWHTCRLAEIGAARGEDASLQKLAEVASTGYPHAQRAYARLSARG